MEQKKNTGVLFKNDKKETSNHPDFKGRINIDGTEYWLSAWTKQGKKDKFISLAVSPKQANSVQRQQSNTQQEGEEIFS